MTKVKSIVVDTFTAWQKNEILNKWEKGKASHDDWKDYGTDIVQFIRKLKEMGFTCIGVIGYEGTGKSFGMSTLPEGECIWYNADKKNPTWKGGKEVFGTRNNPTKFQYVPEGYDDCIGHISALYEKGIFSDEPIAFLIGHVEDYKTSDGQVRQRLKTLGKLAKTMNIEDELNHCYYTEVKKEGNTVKYQFRTQNSGFDTCRSPQGLHKGLYIDNDYNQIISDIENY